MSNEPRTTTIQVWPSGKMYEYCDLDTTPKLRNTGPAKQDIYDEGVMRPATDAEIREIKRNVRALMYQDRDVLCCDSMLVDDLIKASAAGIHNTDFSGRDTVSDLESGFSYDEIRNMYPDPSDWDLDKRIAWLDERGISYDQDDRDNEYIDLINEHAEPAEVYEWWRVTGWLCDQLHAIGEVTIDNGYGHWWGRQATGQGYLMDGTLQQVSDLFDN